MSTTKALHHPHASPSAGITPPRGQGDDADAADLALVHKIRSGQTSHWETLIKRYQDRLFSVCLRMVRDRDLAGDLTQDSFVKIIQGLESFDGRSKLSTWMIRVTMNVCLSKLRSEKLRRHASFDAINTGAGGSAGSGGGEHSGEVFATAEPASGERVEAKEDRERLLQALSLLDPEQRAVLILCDCRGLAYEQIGEVLGVAVGTVKSRVFRARASLRETMEHLGRQ